MRNRFLTLGTSNDVFSDTCVLYCEIAGNSASRKGVKRKDNAVSRHPLHQETNHTQQLIVGSGSSRPELNSAPSE
jgi:hypothetical protein